MIVAWTVDLALYTGRFSFVHGNWESYHVDLKHAAEDRAQKSKAVTFYNRGTLINIS